MSKLSGTKLVSTLFFSLGENRYDAVRLFILNLPPDLGQNLGPMTVKSFGDMVPKLDLSQQEDWSRL